MTSHSTASSRRIRRGKNVLRGTTAVLLALTVAGWLTNRHLGDLGIPLGDLLYACGLSGLVGLGTNWIAIKMLFHPRRPVLGLWGVIPRRRVELAARASELIEERLISGHRLERWVVDSGAAAAAAQHLLSTLPGKLDPTEIERAIVNTASRVLEDHAPALSAELEGRVAEALRAKLGPLAGMAMAVGGGLVKDTVRGVVSDLTSPERVRVLLAGSGVRMQAEFAALSAAPGTVKAVEAVVAEGVQRLFANLHVAQLVNEEFLKQRDEELEQMIDDAAADQLVFLQVAGGVLGVLAGVAMLWPVVALVYLALIAIIWAVARPRPTEAGERRA